MANIRIRLSSDKKINNVNRFSDIDVQSENVSKVLYDRNAVRNAISNILKWKPYERILNPEFGNVLWNNVFEMIGHSTKSDIINQVKKMLAYEPRISVSNIDVSVSANNNTIEVSFVYTIPKLDDTQEEYSITITREQ